MFDWLARQGKVVGMLPKPISHELAEEMALMLDVLEVCIDLGQLVVCGSPCHKKIAELLDKAEYVREP